MVWCMFEHAPKIPISKRPQTKIRSRSNEESEPRGPRGTRSGSADVSSPDQRIPGGLHQMQPMARRPWIFSANASQRHLGDVQKFAG